MISQVSTKVHMATENSYELTLIKLMSSAINIQNAIRTAHFSVAIRRFSTLNINWEAGLHIVRSLLRLEFKPRGAVAPRMRGFAQAAILGSIVSHRRILCSPLSTRLEMVRL